jgi:hypothetical protein
MGLRGRGARAAPSPVRAPEPNVETALPRPRRVASEAAALEVAEALLDEVVRPTTDDEIVVTTVQAYPTCWIVGYNTKAFVESRSIMDALPGSRPVIVNRETGRARLGTHELPPEQQLDA